MVDIDFLCAPSGAHEPTREPAAHEHRQLQDPLAFVFAGRAIFTIRSKRTQKRYTFRVTRADEKPGDRYPAPWFVGLLTGPENTSDYSYLGMIVESEKTVVRTTKASQASGDAARAALSWALRQWAAGREPEDLEVWHMDRCGRCGRPLTVPESIDRGLGPECSSKLGLD